MKSPIKYTEYKKAVTQYFSVFLRSGGRVKLILYSIMGWKKKKRFPLDEKWTIEEKDVIHVMIMLLECFNSKKVGQQ